MNIEDYLNTHLKDGERFIRMVRPHVAMVLPGVVTGTLLMIIDFFLVAWWFQHRTWGAWGFVALLVIAAFIMFRSLFIWRMNLLIVTTHRVIDMEQRGLLDRHVTEAPFEKIQDVKYSIRGLWSTIFQFGTITVQTAGQDALDLRFVVKPVELQRELAELQQRRSSSTGALSATELVTMVGRMKQQLTPEQMKQLFKSDDAQADD